MNSTNQQTINISFNQLIVAFVASTLIAASCVAFITNMVINSKVNALTQTNPVSSTAAAQTNNAPDACVGTATPQTDAANGGASGAGFSVGALTGGKLLAGNYSFSYTNNQTNISNTTNTSTNTAVDSRYSGNTISISALNGNSLNSGNTTNTSTSSVVNTVTSVVTNTTTNTDNSNNSVNNSGNTANTSTTTNTVNDNSNNSVNTVVTGNTAVILP